MLAFLHMAMLHREYVSFLTSTMPGTYVGGILWITEGGSFEHCSLMFKENFVATTKLSDAVDRTFSAELYARRYTL